MKHRTIITGGIVVMAIFLAATPAFAWWSHRNETHAELTYLSFDVMGNISQAQRDAMRKGSREPDRGGLHLDHNRTERRSIDAYCAAVRALVRSQNQSQLVSSANHLAHSFHYLQDRAEPCERFSAGRKNYLRGIAHRVLIDGRFKQSRVWSQALAEYRAKVNNQDLGFIFGYIILIRNRIHGTINAIYNQGFPPQRRDRLLALELVKSFALIKACQDRMLAIFSMDVRACSRGRARCCR